MLKFPSYMPLNKWFTAEEIAMLCNVISWIAVLGICLPEYMSQFDCLFLLKQSDYDKDGWVNMLGLAEIWEALPDWCYDEFKGLLDTWLNWQAFALIYFGFINYIPADYYRLKVNFKLGECIELIMLK